MLHKLVITNLYSIVNIIKNARSIRGEHLLRFYADYFLNFLTNHFSNNDTLKLTTAPSAARTTVLTKSDEPMFTTTVKTVPQTVPKIVPLSML